MDYMPLTEEQLIEIVTRVTMEILRATPGSLGSRATAPSAPSCECSGMNVSSCTSCGYCATRRDDVGTIIDAGAARISARPGVPGVREDLARYIDHTLLKPDTTENDLRKLCDEAKRYHFAAVCVNSANVKFCTDLLAGSGVKVAAVVGFPLGASKTSIKSDETREMIRDGAEEIDMVINIGALKSGDFKSVLEDIRAVVEAAAGNAVKVILETALLDDTEKTIACALAKAAGAHFVKTSTGFGPKGATVEDVSLMRRVVGAKMGVKASGGIRDQETAQKMIAAGATRIGASASVAIVEGTKGGTTY